METIILCGGLGTRLREETEFRPKPMVNIGTQPILWHIMKTYAHYGMNNFILALGYKGEMIKKYFLNYEYLNNNFTIHLGKERKTTIYPVHHEEGWKVTLVNTGEKALKGARLKRLEKFIKGDTFCLTYGDGLSDVKINELLSFHASHKKIVTISGVNIASRFGELKIKGDKVIKFNEKPDKAPGFVNGGYMVMNRDIFQWVKDEDSNDLEVGTFEELARQGELMVFRHPGTFACMDTIRDMDYLNSLWNQNKAFWKIWQ